MQYTLILTISSICVALNAIGHFALAIDDKDLNQNNVQSGALNWKDNEEITLFREYLRIPSVQPDVDYQSCVSFLTNQATTLDLPVTIHYPVNDQNPVVVMTWEGSEPDLPSIMLNSHMDVVPAYEEYWTHPPFAAEMDENGDIFARGAQDTKSIGMQYLAAIRALKQNGIDRLKRTIHVVYVPDEEPGGQFGMRGFVETEAFRSLNIGFMLDEGGEIPTDGSLNVYYGERTVFHTEFVFHGHSGHGSRLLKNTPGEKLSYVLAKMIELRKEEERKLYEQKYPYGNVTSINLTVIKGGVLINLIPTEISASFDIRLSVNIDLDAFKQQLNRWCDEAGGNVTINYSNKGDVEKVTAVDDSNPFWLEFKKTVDHFGIKLNPLIAPGGSDSRFVRRCNIPALGFAPFFNTTTKLHGHDEYINADIYLKGIEIYKEIISNVANV